MHVITGITITVGILVIILLLYLFRILYSIRQSVESANQSIKVTTMQLAETSFHAQKLLKEAHQLTGEVRTKLQATDGWVTALQHAGETVELVANSAKQLADNVTQTVTSRVERTVKKNGPKLEEATEWTHLVFQIWRQWQGMKQRQHHDKERGED